MSAIPKRVVVMLICVAFCFTFVSGTLGADSPLAIPHPAEAAGRAVALVRKGQPLTPEEQIKYANMAETTRPVNTQEAAGGGLGTAVVVVLVVVCVALVATPIVIAGKNLTR